MPKTRPQIKAESGKLADKAITGRGAESHRCATAAEAEKKRVEAKAERRSSVNLLCRRAPAPIKWRNQDNYDFWLGRVSQSQKEEKGKDLHLQASELSS